MLRTLGLVTCSQTALTLPHILGKQLPFLFQTPGMLGQAQLKGSSVPSSHRSKSMCRSPLGKAPGGQLAGV